MWKCILILLISYNILGFDFEGEMKSFSQSVKKANSREEIKSSVSKFYESLKKLEGTKADPDDAGVLRFALDLTLTVQTYTYEECLSARIAHFTNFGVNTEQMNPANLPRMVKLSYGVLTKMCSLKN